MYKYSPNYYIGDLDPKCVEDAIAHAKRDFPNEACGAIINGTYVPFKNAHPEPYKAFLINDQKFFEHYILNEVECLVHSHNDSNMASLLDQQQQIELNIPSLIINLRSNSVMDCIVFGEDKIAPLEGRPFFYGAFDCIKLVQDYMKLILDIDLPTVPHDWEFWLTKNTLFEDWIGSNNNFHEVELKDVKEHDLLFYNISGLRMLNHVAVVINNNKEVYHHMINNVSGRYPINYQRKYLRKVMRYNG